MRPRKALGAVLCLVLAATTLILAPRPAPAAALTGGDFTAGMIITDDLFYDSSAMTAAEVQAFLASHISGPCLAGYTCLKDYRQTTTTRAQDAYCKAYTGRANEAASTIIDSVARACGVSQMVLVVLLQKEQALVTSRNPTAAIYQKATGYGCPDGQPCSSLYYGFFNQVYNAARKYQVYRANPDDYGYHQGRSNYIQYNPVTTCGGSQVYIQNQATAGLYIYTPYQPNAAALRDLSGSGDGCSAFGNRNFWRLYNTWFGSTKAFPVHGGIGAAYRGAGGAAGFLGASTTRETCGLKDSGCYQHFQGGSIHWTKATGAHITKGAIRTAWKNAGWENGDIGYPVNNETCGLKSSGCYQTFQAGSIHWTKATGAHITKGAIATAWKKTGWEQGRLGYPTGEEVCNTAHTQCTQAYQGGTITWKSGHTATITYR